MERWMPDERVFFGMVIFGDREAVFDFLPWENAVGTRDGSRENISSAFAQSSGEYAAG